MYPFSQEFVGRLVKYKTNINIMNYFKIIMIWFNTSNPETSSGHIRQIE